ncbi:MAG: hypothetical protein HQ542_01455 [Bacteroidia bacterium]|nr:hypothetical protein [Bacteroidia bacterium]
MNKFQQARQKYKPIRIKLLFIAEAPPNEYSDRFFYFENVFSHDSLFWELMRYAFPMETKGIETPFLRPKKTDFLLRFKGMGYFLEDAIDFPLPKKISSSKKIKIIKENQQDLLRKLHRLLPFKEVPIILISYTVYKANREFLKSYGYNVIHDHPIAFPLGNLRTRFQEEMNKINFSHE